MNLNFSHEMILFRALRCKFYTMTIIPDPMSPLFFLIVVIKTWT